MRCFRKVTEWSKVGVVEQVKIRTESEIGIRLQNTATQAVRIATALSIVYGFFPTPTLPMCNLLCRCACVFRYPGDPRGRATMAAVGSAVGYLTAVLERGSRDAMMRAQRELEKGTEE